MTVTEPLGLAQMKQATRRTWASGDYDAVAHRSLWRVGERVVQRVGVGTGEDVLDVACGTGNAAVRAAQAGGRVVGVDITPELFDAGRRNADAAGVVVDWREGDAEALPFDDASFDVVLSVFGCMFAPRHQVAAHELVRVLRPGGRLAVAAWTPDGAAGQMFRALGSFLPPPPPFAEPPVLWGVEPHVRDLFAGTGLTLELDREDADSEPFADGAEAFDWSASRFGPMIALRHMLDPEQYERARATLVDLYDPDEPEEYLLVVGRKPLS
jgi:ubiquinone/menaquinone biosynthesis C-methylase UbiE